jgi:hypothetical protein
MAAHYDCEIWMTGPPGCGQKQDLAASVGNGALRQGPVVVVRSIESNHIRLRLVKDHENPDSPTFTSNWIRSPFR